MKEQRKGGFLTAKIHQISGRVFAKLLKKHEIEINPAQGRIMFVLWKKDNIPIQELVEKTSLTKTTLTSMLDRLESMGYIRRVPSQIDRRKINIQLTAKDQELHDKYRQVSQEMTELYYDGMSEAQRDQFDSYLEIIYQNLVEVEEAME